eukprot:TRINITY_DN304_c0_g2_i1.p1 TRINITY_DN304_c0_g2~~TRINITY_DN304_c0_g2_i1.p1  ORF type:complete len:620 (-),score=94.49 TRINITY_DN304_c0_g2_i1:994-2853(-)
MEKLFPFELNVSQLSRIEGGILFLKRIFGEKFQVDGGSLSGKKILDSTDQFCVCEHGNVEYLDLEGLSLEKISKLLLTASKFGSLEIVKTITAKFPSVVENRTLGEALVLASREGELSVVRFLKRNFLINEDYLSLALFACCSNRTAQTDVLCEFLRSNNPAKPLAMIAGAVYGHYSVVKQLSRSRFDSMNLQRAAFCAVLGRQPHIVSSLMNTLPSNSLKILLEEFDEEISDEFGQNSTELAFEEEEVNDLLQNIREGNHICRSIGYHDFNSLLMEVTSTCFHGIEGTTSALSGRTFVTMGFDIGLNLISASCLASFEKVWGIEFDQVCFHRLNSVKSLLQTSFFNTKSIISKSVAIETCLPPFDISKIPSFDILFFDSRLKEPTCSKMETLVRHDSKFLNQCADNSCIIFLTSKIGLKIPDQTWQLKIEKKIQMKSGNEYLRVFQKKYTNVKLKSNTKTRKESKQANIGKIPKKKLRTDSVPRRFIKLGQSVGNIHFYDPLRKRVYKDITKFNHQLVHASQSKLVLATLKIQNFARVVLSRIFKLCLQFNDSEELYSWKRELSQAAAINIMREKISSTHRLRTNYHGRFKVVFLKNFSHYKKTKSISSFIQPESNIR